MELTLDEKLECVLLHLNDNLPLHTISKERGIGVAASFSSKNIRRKQLIAMI